jgi:sugar phosphate permease
MGLGGMVFLVSGGVLADVSWRAPFASYLFAWLLVPASALWLDEPPREKHTRASASAPAVELDRSLLALLYAAAAMGFVLFYLIPVQLPFSLARLGASGARVGLSLGVMTLISSLSSLLYTRLAARFRPATILTGTFLGMIPGFALLAAASSYRAILLALVVLAPPLGQLMPNLGNWLAALSPAATRGRVLGGLTMAIFAGQFVSPIAAAPFVARSGLHGAFGAFAAAAVCAGGVGALVFVLTRSHRAPL